MFGPEIATLIRGFDAMLANRPFVSLLLSGILALNFETLVENPRFKPILPVFGAAVGVTQLEFRESLLQQETSVFALSYDVVCMITRLAVLWLNFELRLVTDRRTDKRPQHILR